MYNINSDPRLCFSDSRLYRKREEVSYHQWVPVLLPPCGQANRQLAMQNQGEL